jgi:hypothetical protein
MNPLDKTLQIFGNKSKIAAKINELYGKDFIQRMTVYHWDRIPPDWAIEIENITNGKVEAREILDYAHKVKVENKTKLVVK